MGIRFANAEMTLVSMDRDGVEFTGPWPAVDGEWQRWVGEALGEKKQPDPAISLVAAPDAFTILPKGEIWRRVTDAEAEAIEAAFAAAPLRLRKLFDAVPHLDSMDADYPALRAGFVKAFGEKRADEILKPTQ